MTGGDGLWSNPNGADWTLNGVLVPANNYPGKAGSTNDIVLFSNGATSPCRLDVPLANSLLSLQFTAWVDTLTLSTDLVVTGSTGSFDLSDGSTISMGANVSFSLANLGLGAANTWSKGTITGAAGSGIYVNGSTLTISGDAGPLGTNLNIASAANGGGQVVLDGMDENLTLNGATNFIDARAGGTLSLNQTITDETDEDQLGGIDVGQGHTGPAAQVEVGGSIWRSASGPSPAGVLNQVEVAGPVYNNGGTVEVWSVNGNMLNLSGTDSEGFSYWQRNAPSAVLQVDTGGNIQAAGTYEIDTGTVNLTASSSGSADELDGAGLNFANTFPTALTFLHPNRMGGVVPGAVTVQGPVTLAQRTTVNMSFTGASNAFDQLDVLNGELVLNGTLNLTSTDRARPTAPLAFFDDSDASGQALISGSFTSIMDSTNGTDTGGVVEINPTEYQYQVTIL